MLRIVWFWLFFYTFLGANDALESFLRIFTRESPSQVRSISAGFDNDFFTSKNNDRFYTHGSFIAYETVDFSQKTLYQNGLILSQKIFTPQDLEKTPDEIGSDDRPYAGLLLLDAYQAKHTNAYSITHALTVGCLGPCAYSGDVQSSIHEWMIGRDFEDTVIPAGWDSQIKNQMVLNYRYTHMIDYDRRSWDSVLPFHLAIKPYGEISVGTLYDNALAGLRLEGTFSPKRAPSVFDPHSSLLKQKIFSRSWDHQLFLDVKAGPRLYDATVQGNLFDRQKGLSRELNPWLVHTSVGFQVRFDRYILHFAQNLQSPDLKSADWKANRHVYGSLRISYLW